MNIIEEDRLIETLIQKTEDNKIQWRKYNYIDFRYVTIEKKRGLSLLLRENVSVTAVLKIRNLFKKVQQFFNPHKTGVVIELSDHEEVISIRTYKLGKELIVIHRFRKDTRAGYLLSIIIEKLDDSKIKETTAKEIIDCL